MPDTTRARKMMPRTVFLFDFIMNSSLSKTGLFVIKFAIHYKTLNQLVGEESDLRVQACFQFGNKPVMMTDHCESGDYIEGAKAMMVVLCLRWVTLFMMCCNI